MYVPSRPNLNLATAEGLQLELESLRQRLATRAEQTRLLRAEWSKSAQQTGEQVQGLGKKKKVHVCVGLGDTGLANLLLGKKMHVPVAVCSAITDLSHD